MPLLRRKVLQRVAVPLKDNDEVFVCETTGELFSNYDDYFNRTMLLSSTVWTCAMTGRSNLTYRDALESERSTKRTVKLFPAALKGPILLIASRTKRTGIHDLASDVHGYVKDVFFKGETVYTKTGDPETTRKAKIVRVVISGSPSDHIPSRLIYHVESCDEGTTANYAVRGEAIIRERKTLSREKCKLFLKQHVELGSNQMLCVKKASLEQFVTSKGCTDDKVFYGQIPAFEVSKKLQKQMMPNKKKKQNIETCFKQSANDSVGKKKAIVEKKKISPEERAEKKLLAKELMLLEKALLVPQVALALKEYSTIKDDLELTDQCVIPRAREVRTIIGEEHFPDFLFILEFLNTFSDLLSIETKFPDGITMEILERALLQREMNGPLSDILQLLLWAIFSALNNIETSEEANRESGTKVAKVAKVAKKSKKHFFTKLTELRMDSTTVSELLRLHIIAYNDPIYFGDACFILIRDHPHIMQTLTTHTVFQLPVKHVMQIICALIHQLLVTDEVLSRAEKVGDARIKYKNNQLERRRVTRRATLLKQIAQDDMKKQLASYVGQMPDHELDECRKKLEQKLNNKLARIESHVCFKMKEVENELEALKQNYNLYQVHLGCDRGFRNYWQFQSLPGLFVEHDKKRIVECCMERTIPNIPGLAQCELRKRRIYITNSILKCAGKSGELLKKDGDVYEELLIRGSSLLARSKKRKKDTLLLDKHPTNRELFMCTGNEENCPVHTPNHQSIAKWSYYATRQELDALIKSLNRRGRRERSLRETLMLYRDSIESRIDMCPIEKLSIQENDRPMDGLFEPQHNKPDQLMPHSDLLETMFRESLLDLEGRITVGCLGDLKVNSIEKWRNAIIQRSYDSQTKEQLQWGLNRNEQQHGYVKKANQESSSKESEEQQVDKNELCKIYQGYDLPKTVNTDEFTLNQDALHATSETLQDTVRSMASALLQVEQSIDIKFFRHPFGPKGTCRDPNVIMFWQHKGQRKLLHWEASLMRATSFSQLFLHYHVLYDAIRWSRSIERAVCMVCNLKGDSSVTLLCDECNRACHMHCLKPKLKEFPEGDWFCVQCRSVDNTPKYSATGRKLAQLMDYYESDASEQDSENEDDSDGNGSGIESSHAETESEAEISSSDETYESDDEDEDYDPKIEIEKKAKLKKQAAEAVLRSARRLQETQNLQNLSLQPKRIRQKKTKKEEHAKKRKPSENINCPTVARQSLDASMKKVNTPRSAPRTTRNQEKGTAQNETLQKDRHNKRARQTESKKEGHAKKQKTSKNMNSSFAGRRSLRLSTKEV